MGIGFVSSIAKKQSQEVVTGSLRDMDAGAYIGELARIQKLTWARRHTDAPTPRLRPNLHCRPAAFGLDAAPTDHGLTPRRRWDEELHDIPQIVSELQGQGPNRGAGRYPDLLPGLDPLLFERPGRRYLDETHVYRRGRLRFVEQDAEQLLAHWPAPPDAAECADHRHSA
jgi:hypothetical protein